MHGDGQHDHSGPAATASGGGRLRVLAIDIGAGTQDIVLYDSAQPVENAVKLVMPSQTQVVAARIREVTRAGRPLHLAGRLMGGGASSDAIAAHLAAGLSVSATPDAARTLHNRPERVAALGVVLREEAPTDAVVVALGDIDLAAIARALGEFGVAMPEVVAIAVQDHGYRPGAGNNDVRFEYLQGLIAGGGDLAGMVFTEPPPAMTRMASVAASAPGAYLMDTGAAAVLGVLGDPVVGAAVRTTGAIVVNVGNMHTFAALVRGRRLYGLFEHHTGGMTPELLTALVEALRAGTLDAAGFASRFDGHGAAIADGYAADGPFPFVAITGPNRGRMRGLGYYEAAPHGDMMLAGSYGLVEGVCLALEAAGRPTGITLAR
jgi:uncharacterized protein (DUF1786 family)